MVKFIEAPPTCIRPDMRTYNLQAISFTPAELADELRKYFPDLQVDYQPDDRQIIGELGIDSTVWCQLEEVGQHHVP